MNSNYINHIKSNFLLGLKSLSYGYDGYIITHNGKQKIKLGKFINTIITLVNEYGHNVNRTKNDIEKIVDKYKSFKYNPIKYKFKILNGNDILTVYDSKNYEYRLSSSLTNSCMNNKFNNLEIYVKNKDKVSLLTLNNDDKIVGRALLWKMDKPKYIFMDRVYSIDNHINEYFTNLAKSNNWVYRQNNANNNFVVNCYMKDIDGYLVKNSNDIRMSVNLDIKGIKKFPYMDSFVYKSHLNNNFYINNNWMINFNRYQSTHGDVSKCVSFKLLSLFS